ncbi:hypothetical protein CR513_48867, partial [Mucuna pruriens]
MTSLIMSFAPATGRVFAAKGASGIKEEKGLLDWILGGLQKEDQLLETDPILKKVEEKSGRKNSLAVPQKKEDPADFDLVKEDEPRCKDLLGEIKRRAFVTLSARSFTSSMGEVSDCHGILNMQLFTCPFLLDFLLEFCLKDKPAFSLM